MFKTRKHIAAALAVGAGAVAIGGAGVASAAGGTHTQTMTDNYHGIQTTSQVNPCNNDTINFTGKTNTVSHLTYFPGSDEMWGTFTEEDSLSGVDPTTNMTYTGHDTFWGNINVNRQNSESGFTATIGVKGSDGTTISYHRLPT